MHRVLELAYDRNEFSPSDDGYFYWWHSAGGGCISANDLRILADELDRLNAGWDAEITEYFETQRRLDESQAR